MSRLSRRIQALVFGACMLAAPACAEGSSGSAVKLDSDDQKTIYAMGHSLARNLAPFSLSAEELQVLFAGVEDGVLGRESKVDLAVYGQTIQTLAQKRSAGVAEAERSASESFLAAAAEEEGAVRKDSGLVIRVLEDGTGPSPGASDTVKVHYHGTLRDGSVFDSSVDRGVPATFPLNRVIPCWTEAVQEMKVGGKSKITCPSNIAYGDRGAPPKIKPGAALSFEVELLEIVAKP